jgi:hypothetical protein
LRRHDWLPASLKSAISTPMVPGYGRDDGDVDRGGGINLVPGQWTPPTNPTLEDLAAARLWLRVYDSETTIVSADALRKWLVTFLGNLAVGSGSGESDLNMRVKLLSVAVDERAAKHFTKESLKLAWERFKFIPTANELMAFFDDLESRERTEAQRLMAVLDAGAKPPPPKAEPVDVDESMRRFREKQQQENRVLAEVLRERDAAAGKFAPDAQVLQRAPGESDKAYGIRLAEQCRQQITIGEQALKRDNRRRAMEHKAATKTAYDATKIKVQPKPDDQTANETARNAMSGGEG